MSEWVENRVMTDRMTPSTRYPITSLPSTAFTALYSPLQPLQPLRLTPLAATQRNVA